MEEELSPGISIYVINLERSPDRLEKISEQLQQLNLPFERVTAIDGKLATPEQSQCLDLSLYKKRHGKLPTPGELGCYLSHYKAICMAANSDQRFSLILEDDAILSAGLSRSLNALAAVATHWDLVKLSGVHSGTPIRVRTLSTGENLSVLLTKCTGASAYLINKKASMVLRDGLLPMGLPIDHEIDKAWHYQLQVRGLLPFPITHNTEAVSTIGDIPKSLKLPSHQRIPTHLYRLKTEVQRLACGLEQVVRSRFQR
jgi:glycosyl transferase family 25